MQPSLIFLGCLAASIVYCDLFHRMSRNVNQMSKDTFIFLFIKIYIPEKRTFIMMTCTIMGFLNRRGQISGMARCMCSFTIWQHMYCMCSDIIWHVVCTCIAHCAIEAVFSTSDPTVANHGCNSFRISLNFHKSSKQHIQYSLVVGTKFVYWIPSQVSELDTC